MVRWFCDPTDTADRCEHGSSCHSILPKVGHSLRPWGSATYAAQGDMFDSCRLYLNRQTSDKHARVHSVVLLYCAAVGNPNLVKFSSLLPMSDRSRCFGK